MITRENVSNADATRAFGPEVLTCPDCGHGIDPHGTDPGGPCGVSRCPCLLQPNGIACLLIEERVRAARAGALAQVSEVLDASTAKFDRAVGGPTEPTRFVRDIARNLRNDAEEVRRA